MINFILGLIIGSLFAGALAPIWMSLLHKGVAMYLAAKLKHEETAAALKATKSHATFETQEVKRQDHEKF